MTQIYGADRSILGPSNMMTHYAENESKLLSTMALKVKEEIKKVLNVDHEKSVAHTKSKDKAWFDNSAKENS